MFRLVSIMQLRSRLVLRWAAMAYTPSARRNPSLYSLVKLRVCVYLDDGLFLFFVRG